MVRSLSMKISAVSYSGVPTNQLNGNNTEGGDGSKVLERLGKLKSSSENWKNRVGELQTHLEKIYYNTKQNNYFTNYCYLFILIYISF